MGNQNTPRDESWLRAKIDALEARLRALETAPRTRHAGVSGGVLRVRDGGALRVTGQADTQAILHVGRDDQAGSSHRVWVGRPKDGSAILDLRAAAGEAGQWAMRDQAGNAVVAEGPAGVGLARPVMPVATQWIADFPGSWPSTTSTSWTSLAYAWAIFQHTSVSFWFKASALSVAGQIRFRIGGSVIATRNVPTGTPAPIRTERFTVDATQYYNPSGPLLVELQARCNSNGGGIHATPFYNEGAGSVPATEPPS